MASAEVVSEQDELLAAIECAATNGFVCPASVIRSRHEAIGKTAAAVVTCFFRKLGATMSAEEEELIVSALKEVTVTQFGCQSAAAADFLRRSLKRKAEMQQTAVSIAILYFTALWLSAKLWCPRLCQVSLSCCLEQIERAQITKDAAESNFWRTAERRVRNTEMKLLRACEYVLPID